MNCPCCNQQMEALSGPNRMPAPLNNVTATLYHCKTPSCPVHRVWVEEAKKTL